MENQYYRKLIILYILLLGTVSCGSFTRKNKFEWSELSNVAQEDYIGGFSQDTLFIAKRVIDYIKNDQLSSSCESTSEHTNLINEQLPKPQNHLSEDSRLNKLNLLIQSDNQLVRDLSLYVVSQIGPAASELLPWLKHYQSHDHYFSNWMHQAIENISCQNWVLTRFNQPYKRKLLKFDFIEKLKKMTTEDLFFPPKEIQNFISNNLDGMDDEIEPSDLLMFIKASYIKKSIKAEIISALSVEALKILQVDLRQYKEFIENIHIGENIKYLFLESSDLFGIEIIRKELEQNNLRNIEFLCNYGDKAKELEVLLLEKLKSSEEKYDVESIIKSLGCIESEMSIDYLIPYLQNQDWEFQITVIEALKSINLNHDKVQSSLEGLLKSTWSGIVRNYITGHNPFITEECLKDDYYGCPEYEPLAVKMWPSANDHGMMNCEDKQLFSYDENNWFKVNWQSSDNTLPPEGFPEDFLSEWFSHSILAVEDGWIFASDHGHYDGHLFYWSGDFETSYYIKTWTDAFKVLKHKDKIIALGYSIVESNVGGDLFEIFKEKSTQKWMAKIILDLPSPPSKFGFDPDGELIIADALNHYGVKSNKITPLFCK